MTKTFAWGGVSARIPTGPATDSGVDRIFPPCQAVDPLLYRLPIGKEAALAYSLTASFKHNRWSVVDVIKEGGRLCVKGVENARTDLSCAGARVVIQEGRTKDLDSVRPECVALVWPKCWQGPQAGLAVQVMKAS